MIYLGGTVYLVARWHPGWGLALWLLWFGYVCLSSRRRHTWLPAALPLWLTWSLAWFDARDQPAAWSLPPTEVGDLTVGLCERARTKGERWQVLVEVLADRRSGEHWLRRGDRLMMRGRDAPPPYGRWLWVSGRIQAPRPPRNFGSFDERRYLAGRGAVASLEVTQWQSSPMPHGDSLRREIVEPLRLRLRSALTRHLSSDLAGLSAALVLGIRDGTPATIVEEWRSLGLSHLLAISGLHLGLFAAGLWWLLGSPRSLPRLLTFATGIVFFALLTGLASSVVRASGMALWLAVARFLKRRATPWRTLVFVGLAMLIGQPQRIFDLGFQLSMAATGGILAWAPLFGSKDPTPSRWRRWRHGIVCGVCISIAAQLATLPFLFSAFGWVSWLAPLLNLFVVPLVHAALSLLFLATPALLLCDSVARPLCLVAASLLQGSLWITHWTATKLSAITYVSASPAQLGALAVCCTGVLLGVRWGHRGRRGWGRVLAIASLCGLGVLLYHLQRPEPCDWCFEAIDVGQGDAFLLELGSERWLIDTGHHRPIDHGRRTILPTLKRRGIRQLRGVILSHPHADHCGGAGSLLDAVTVDTLYVARASRHEPAYESFALSGVPIRYLSQGENIQLAAAYRARVLWPPAEDVLQSGPNGQSLVLWARGPGRPDLLCMGDLEEDGEHALLRQPALLSDMAANLLVLKVGHHGSGTSSRPDFLELVDPEVAVISVGRKNRYGHPSPETLQNLARRQCRVFRTDRGGAVQMRAEAGRIYVQRPGRAPLALEILED